jgi:hypothetical protein
VLGSFVAASGFLALGRKELSVNSCEGLVFVITFAFVTWWFLNQAPNTKEYLLPYVEGGLTETFGICGDSGDAVGAGEEAGEQRDLFAGSTIALHGIILSSLTPVPAALAMTLAANVYFAAYPMMLSETGAEGALRSWSFARAGLAVLAATGIQLISLWEKRTRRVHGMWAVVAAFMILMVRNLAAGMNEVYRFSGRFVYGSDARSVTNKIHYFAEWLVDTQGTNQKATVRRRSSFTIAPTRCSAFPMTLTRCGTS